MSLEITPVNYEKNLCFKCLEKSDNIQSHNLCSRGYGSLFDCVSTCLQVCEKCSIPEMNLWFDEKPNIKDGYLENYVYEEKIKQFIKTLPIQGKELFYNSCARGTYYSGIVIDPSDWIQLELRIAPKALYAKYLMDEEEEF